MGGTIILDLIFKVIFVYKNFIAKIITLKFLKLRITF